eukprot:8172959-Pyramimonas_sp.AAC.1
MAPHRLGLSSVAVLIANSKGKDASRVEEASTTTLVAAKITDYYRTSLYHGDLIPFNYANKDASWLTSALFNRTDEV